MCVFEVDGVVNLVVSSKTLDQNLSTDGNKGVFFLSLIVVLGIAFFSGFFQVAYTFSIFFLDFYFPFLFGLLFFLNSF